MPNTELIEHINKGDAPTIGPQELANEQLKFLLKRSLRSQISILYLFHLISFYNLSLKYL